MKDTTAPAAELSSSEREVETFNKMVGGRIRHIRTDVLRLSVAAMAAEFGVGTSTIQRYESGERTADAFFLAQVAGRGGVSVNFLCGLESPSGASQAPSATSVSGAVDTLGNTVDISEFVFIPRYNVKAAAGHGQAVTDEAPTHTMAFRRYWIENYLHANPADLSVLSVKGDSQRGVLEDRDVILIDRSQVSGTAGLYVLRIDGDVIVKTLQRLPGGVLRVSSANPNYEPFEVNLSQPPADLAIIGRVVWFGRQV